MRSGPAPWRRSVAEPVVDMAGVHKSFNIGRPDETEILHGIDFRLVRERNREQGAAVLFVTHNPDLAARCDRTIRVVDGQLDLGSGAP